MVAAVLLLLVVADTFATGYLVAVFGRIRKSERELVQELSVVSHDVDCLADDLGELHAKVS